MEEPHRLIPRAIWKLMPEVRLQLLFFLFSLVLYLLNNFHLLYPTLIPFFIINTRHACSENRL